MTTPPAPRALWAGLALLCSACAAPGDRTITAYGGLYSDNALLEEILPLREIKFEESQLTALAYAEPFHRFWEDKGQWEWEVQAV